MDKRANSEMAEEPDLYTQLSPILSITNIESDEINQKADELRSLLNGFG